MRHPCSRSGGIPTAWPQVRRVAGAVGAITLVTCLGGTTHAARAATPVPDRPTLSRTGLLVASDTLEVEAGSAFATLERSRVTSPALVKYSFAGAVEPRVGFDLAGLGQDSPGLGVGAKVRVLEQGVHGLAAYASTSVPVGPHEAWRGELLGLWTAHLDSGAFVQINAGTELVPSQTGSIGFGGVPLVLTLGSGLSPAIDAFVDGAAVANDGGVSRGVVHAGLSWHVTEIAVVDTGAGWLFDDEVPVFQLGLTANLGALGG